MGDEFFAEGPLEKEVLVVSNEDPNEVSDLDPNLNPNPEPDIDIDITDHRNENGAEDGKAVDGDDGIPRVDMVFESFEDVYDFYNQYARRTGFGVKIRRSWYSTDDGQCNKFMLTCCKEGRREYKNSERCSSYRLRLTARTDCQARIKVMKRYVDGLFHVTDVNLEHNHPVSPSMSPFFRSHKDVHDGGKKLPVLRGKGQKDVAMGETDGEGSLGKVRPLFLARDDIEALQQFFVRMQSMNTNFFHLIDLDEYGRLNNVFWADGRCKGDYQYFRDVVTLDTSCLTNNYETPLVSFVGVNHHGHLVLLGCAFLSDRSVKTYTWLLKAWMSCMSGSSPDAIITDHCKAIQDAVAEVLPGARHYLCLSYIMQRIQENLGGYVEYKSIKRMMKKVVCDSLRIDEFEDEWGKMIGKYGLEDNEWLKSLYENRHYWVPASVKETFWAGTCYSQNKENMGSFFDGHIHPKNSVKQFLCKYEVIVQSKYEKEVQADHDSFHKSPQLISKFYMEDQLRKIYTVDMFKKFQEEVKAILYCIPSLVRVDGPISIFEVKEPLRMRDGNQMDNKNYEVTYNANEQDVRCICCSFQSIGILCRHTLSVLNFLEVYEIPQKFISYRWQKDYKQRHRLPSTINAVANGRRERYDNLYTHCLKFVDTGSISDELYGYALKMISEVIEELIASDCTVSDMLPRTYNTINGQSLGDEDDDINDLGQVRHKGQASRKRKETLSEKIVKTSRKKVAQRKPMVANESDVLHITADTPHFDPHIWAQESINLTEQVSPTNLSIGHHFGVQMNHPHALDSQSGIRWSFQQMFQQAHTPEAPPGPWAG